MNTSTRDAGIPVLTEVITAPEAGSVAPNTVAPNTVAPAPTYPAAPPAVPAPFENKNGATLSSDEWNQLEREIRERILRQIVGRIDALLEQRLRDGMSTVLQTVVQTLTAEIKSSLHLTIDDVVTRAVAQEISRMQTSKK